MFQPFPGLTTAAFLAAAALGAGIAVRDSAAQDAPAPQPAPAQAAPATAAQATPAAGRPAPTAAPLPPLAPITLEGDAARGAVLAETCKGCHGVPESHNAYPSYYVPKLGGQNADYIEVALQGYRRGSRSHPTMQAQASSLSDQDIADVAAFFSSLPGEPEKGKSDASTPMVEEGKRKAGACLQCHGEAGVATAMQWPNLAGQHESYLEQALKQYQTGQRADLLMAPIVASLDEAAIENLAAYFSAQPYLHQTPQ
jgi:cytochrome c553